MLVHMIDVSAATSRRRGGRSTASSARTAPGLDERPQIVVLNKIDLLPEAPGFDVDDERILRVFALSCATGAGLEEFRRGLFELVPPAEPEPVDVTESMARLPRVPAAAARGAPTGSCAPTAATASPAGRPRTPRSSSARYAPPASSAATRSSSATRHWS